MLDANTGQNAVAQVKAFDDALGVTGIVLTKLDGTAKGGCIAAIARQKPIPIRFVGVGEQIDDLRPSTPGISWMRCSTETRESAGVRPTPPPSQSQFGLVLQGLSSLGIVAGSVHSLDRGVAELNTLFGWALRFREPGLTEGRLAMLASAVVLGWLGVGLSASCRFRTLRQYVKPLRRRNYLSIWHSEILSAKIQFLEVID